MKFGTKAVHGNLKPDEQTGAVNTPIYMTSTFAQSSPGVHKGFEYARTQNPTRADLEKALAYIENAKFGLAFSSGLAATNNLLSIFKPGDEIISSIDIYGGTYRIFEKVYSKYGIKFIYFNPKDINNLEKLINNKTKLIWLETPGNPLLNVIDITYVTQIAKKHNILVCVDNTFASPYNQNPLDLGADIVIHSITKYIAGHSDLIMGASMCNNEELAKTLYFHQNSVGSVPSPQDCYLVLRGIKTLHLRMERHNYNAKEVVKFLIKHPKVDKVYYPGIETNSTYNIAKKQMRDFGGMISFTLKDYDLKKTVEVLCKFKLFILAESLGGVESLVGHPASMTHASIPKEIREKLGVVDSLIRLSVGVEDVEDIINDINQAIG